MTTRRTRRSRRTKNDPAPAPSTGKSKGEEQGGTDDGEDTKSDVAESLDSEPAEEQDGAEAATPVAQNKGSASAATRRSTRSRRATSRSVQSSSQNPPSTRGKRRRPSNDSTSTATKDHKGSSKGDDDHTTTGGSEDERDSEEETPQGQHDSRSINKPQRRVKRRTSKRSNSQQSLDEASDDGGEPGDEGDGNSTTKSGGESQGSDDEISKKRKPSSSSRQQRKRRRPAQTTARKEKNAAGASVEEEADDGTASLKSGATSANASEDEEETDDAEESKKKDLKKEENMSDSDDEEKSKKASPRRRLRSRKPQATSRSSKSKKRTRSEDSSSSDDDDGSKDAVSSNSRASGGKRKDGKAKRGQASITDSGAEENIDSSGEEDNDEEASKDDKEKGRGDGKVSSGRRLRSRQTQGSVSSSKNDKQKRQGGNDDDDDSADDSERRPTGTTSGNASAEKDETKDEDPAGNKAGRLDKKMASRGEQGDAGDKTNSDEDNNDDDASQDEEKTQKRSSRRRLRSRQPPLSSNNNKSRTRQHPDAEDGSKASAKTSAEDEEQEVIALKKSGKSSLRQTSDEEDKASDGSNGDEQKAIDGKETGTSNAQPKSSRRRLRSRQPQATQQQKSKNETGEDSDVNDAASDRDEETADREADVDDAEIKDNESVTNADGRDEVATVDGEKTDETPPSSSPAKRRLRSRQSQDTGDSGKNQKQQPNDEDEEAGPSADQTSGDVLAEDEKPNGSDSANHSRASEGGDQDEDGSDTNETRDEDAKDSPPTSNRRGLRSQQQANPTGRRAQKLKQPDEKMSDDELDKSVVPPSTRKMPSTNLGDHAETKDGDQISDKDQGSVASSEENTVKSGQYDNGDSHKPASSTSRRRTRNKPSDAVEDPPERASRSRAVPTEGSAEESEPDEDTAAQDEKDVSQPGQSGGPPTKDENSSSAVSRRSRRLQQTAENSGGEDEGDVSDTPAASKLQETAEDNSPGMKDNHDKIEMVNDGEPADSGGDDKSVLEDHDEADQSDDDDAGATSRSGRRLRNRKSDSSALTSKSEAPKSSEQNVDIGDRESLETGTADESITTKKEDMNEPQNHQIESEQTEEASKSAKAEGIGTDVDSKEVEGASLQSSLRRSKRRPSQAGSSYDDDANQSETNRVDDSLQPAVGDSTSISVQDRTFTENGEDSQTRERPDLAKGDEGTNPEAGNGGEGEVSRSPPGADGGDRTKCDEGSTLPSETSPPSNQEPNEADSQEAGEPEIEKCGEILPSTENASLAGQDKETDSEMMHAVQAEPPTIEDKDTEKAAPEDLSEEPVEGDIGLVKGISVSDPSDVCRPTITPTNDEETGKKKEGEATDGDRELAVEPTGEQDAAPRGMDVLSSSHSALPTEPAPSDARTTEDNKQLSKAELESKTTIGGSKEKGKDTIAADGNLVDVGLMEESTRVEKSKLTNTKVDPGKDERSTYEPSKSSATKKSDYVERSGIGNSPEIQTIDEKPNEPGQHIVRSISENDGAFKEDNENSEEKEITESTRLDSKEATNDEIPEDKTSSASTQMETDDAENVASDAPTEQVTNVSTLTTSEGARKSTADMTQKDGQGDTPETDVTGDGDKPEPSNIRAAKQIDTFSMAAPHGSPGAAGAPVGDQSAGDRQETVANPPSRMIEQPNRTEKVNAAEVNVTADQSDDDIDQFHDAQMELPLSEPSSPEPRAKGSILGTPIEAKEGDKMDVEVSATGSSEPIESEKYHEALSQSEPPPAQTGSSLEKGLLGKDKPTDAASPEDPGSKVEGPVLKAEDGLKMSQVKIASQADASQAEVESISKPSMSASDHQANAEGLGETDKVTLTEGAIAPELRADPDVGTDKNTSYTASDTKSETKHPGTQSDDPSSLVIDATKSSEAKIAEADDSGPLPEEHKMKDSTREAVSDMKLPVPTTSAVLEQGQKRGRKVEQDGVSQYSSESDDESDFENSKPECDGYYIEDQETGGLSEVFSGYDVHKIDRVKSKLYSIGSLTHRGRGFERKFADYWEAMSLRLSDTLSRHMMARCQAALKAFLKTKKLRRLHNQLVMGLMQRASCNKAPLDDVAEYVPREWHPRISGAKKLTSRIGTGAKKTEGDHKTSKPKRGDQPREPPLYRQAWTEDVDGSLNNIPYAKAGSTTENLGLDIVETTSSRIPGALVVDPLVRRIVQGAGMRVNESAIWLLVVAVKAHTEATLKKVVNTKGMLEELDTPTAPPSSATPQGKPVASTSTDRPDGRGLIGAPDMCAISATMPLGPIGSLGGSLSRGVFERCLHASYDSNPVSRGIDFLQIQKFLTSEILSSASRRAKVERMQSKNVTPVNTKTDNTNTIDSSPKHETQEAEKEVATKSSGLSAMAQRPSIRGLGRGAKNLAALKARASSGGSTELDNNSGRSQTSNDDADKPNVVSNKQNEGSSTGEDAGAGSQATGDEKDGESSPGSSSPGMQGRRGKGFGVKNLAAMRARSIQKPPTAGSQKESGT